MGKFLPIALAVLLLFGCSRKPEKPVAVVSKIAVTYEQENLLVQKTFTGSDKMHQILNRLRLLGQRFTPEWNPEELPGRGSAITLTRSDGTQQIWRTKGGRFILQAPGPWQQVESERVGLLESLIRTLPGDGPDMVVPILQGSG